MSQELPYFSGCPVSWLISNRDDEATMTIFLKKIQLRCPDAVMNSLMTDDGMFSNLSMQTT